MDNIERARNVIYQLFSSPFGLKNIQEPVGYDNDTRGYERDADSRGFLIKTDIDLEFYGDGADYIERLFETYGINEKCTLTKYERDDYSLSESFKIRYIQEIDLGTYKKDSRTGKVTVNATEGGLYTDIKNRESDEYDLINNESADGDFIGEIDDIQKEFKPIPRSLFLQSLLKNESKTLTYNIRTKGLSSNNTTTRGTRTLPLQIEYKSGDDVQTPYNSNDSNNEIDASESIDLLDVEDVGNIFYWRSDIERKVRVKLDVNFYINDVYRRNISDASASFRAVLKKSQIDSESPENDIIIFTDTLVDPFPVFDNIGVAKTINYDEEVRLKEGESLSVCFETFATVNTTELNIGTGSINVGLNVSNCNLTLEDNTDYFPSVSRCLKPLDFFERIIAKITGKRNLVTSSIFGVGGEYESMVIDNGFWARQFPNTYLDSNDEEQSIQMKTSFKDAFESFNYLEPLCWFTYFDGNTEKIRIEKATYTQQNFVGVDLGAVDEINSEASKMDFFSKIKLGHSQSMEYEELSGLDEPNGLSELNSFINKTNSIYNVVSKFRTDPTGYELTRRKSYLTLPKEDTKRDDNIWIHDARKLSDGSYTHNLWDTTINGQQLLDEIPKGVFKGENFWNFRLSPMNRLYYGHAYSIKRGLFHFPNKSIRFSSSNANQNLITVSNGVTLAENGSLRIDSLPKPRVEPEKINFTFKMNQLIEDTLLGYTMVNGELVPNYFGLIKYKEKGEENYGRLVSLDTSDKAQMTIIKARL